MIFCSISLTSSGIALSDREVSTSWSAERPKRPKREFQFCYPKWGAGTCCNGNWEVLTRVTTWRVWHLLTGFWHMPPETLQKVEKSSLRRSVVRVEDGSRNTRPFSHSRLEELNDCFINLLLRRPPFQKALKVWKFNPEFLNLIST